MAAAEANFYQDGVLDDHRDIGIYYYSRRSYCAFG